MGVGSKPGDFTFVHWRVHLWAPSESDDIMLRDVWTRLTREHALHQPRQSRLQPFRLLHHSACVCYL